MVNEWDAFRAPPTRRVRLGRWCQRSGLLQVLQFVRARAMRDLRVLAYHRVLTVADPAEFDFDLELVSASVEDFRRQMQLLKRRFTPLPLRQAVAALADGRDLPRDAVVVTFDDGYDDNFRHAYPVLQELDIPATFFVSSGNIDSGLPYIYDWFVHMVLCTREDELSLPEIRLARPIPASRAGRWQLAWQALNRLKRLDVKIAGAVFRRLQGAWGMRPAPHRDCRPMTWEQLREMHAAGFEIGSHGVSHHMLTQLSQSDLQGELRGSRMSIERELGVAPVSLAYPVGGYDAFDRRVVRAAKRAGYEFACTFLRGTNGLRDSDRFGLRRLPVERYMDAAWFTTMLTLPGLVGFPPTEAPSAEDA